MNGHSISGAHQRLFELATKAGIRPTWAAIATKAGLNSGTVRQAFGEPGKSVNSRTIEGLSHALRISPMEVRQIHAALQLEAPVEPPPRPAPKTDPAPPPEPEPDPTPRDFMAELCEHCLKCTPVVVATHDPNVGTTMVAGRVVNIYNGWVAVFSPGDKRASRVRIENITDVRRASGID